jgi:WD40 repeat protein
MKMMLYSLLTLLFALPVVAVQETPIATDWAIVERCIATPSQPPDGWTYDGVIFTYIEDDGVHASRADMATSYYVALAGWREFGQSGRFSPNGRWIAIPIGRVEVSFPTSYSYLVDEIRVYNTAPTHTASSFDTHYKGLTGVGLYVRPVSWLDDNHFVAFHKDHPYSEEETSFVYDLLSGEVIPLEESSYSDFVFGSFYAAPRIHTYGYDPFSATYTLVVSNGSTTAEIPLPIKHSEFNLLSDSIVQWTSDYSHFAALLTDREGIGLFDRNGQIQAFIPLTGYPDELRLAGDGKQVAYVEPNGTLMIADFETHTITDTCIETPYSVAFSPDGDQFAFGLESVGYISILDLETWQAYNINLAAADVVGWYSLE